MNNVRLFAVCVELNGEARRRYPNAVDGILGIARTKETVLRIIESHSRSIDATQFTDPVIDGRMTNLSCSASNELGATANYTMRLCEVQ